MTADRNYQSQHIVPPVSVVNPSEAEKVLLSDGWHNIKGNAEIVPYTIGASAQTDFRTGVKFTDGDTNEEMLIDKNACLGFSGGISVSDPSQYQQSQSGQGNSNSGRQSSNR